MRTTLFLVILSAACSESGASHPPAAKLPVDVLVEGKPMPVEHALLKRRPDANLQLYLGEGGSCQELFDGLYDGRKQFVLVDLPPRLAPDGKESYGVRYVHVHGPSEAEGTAAVRGDLAKGAKPEIELNVTSQEAKVSIRGKLPVESCGDEPEDGPLPKAHHASTATMTIAGKSFPIRAALVHADGVELSDFPRDCTVAHYIGVRLEQNYEDWALSGEHFASEVRGEGKGLAVKPGAKGTSADGPTVQLALSGSGKVGDYPVAITGTVEALDCQ